MKKTVLHEKHLALKAKMASFGGYEMPIQYESVIKEHNSCRSQAAIFDTCHMGVFEIAGGGAVSDLERVLSCDIADIKIGACRYGFICNENGGVIDDQILYRVDDDCFLMVVNASTKEGDFEWIKNHLSKDTKFEDVSGEHAKIDLQGPLAPKIASALLKSQAESHKNSGDEQSSKKIIEDLKFYNFDYVFYKDEMVMISRTGYTGEIGFEIYGKPEVIAQLWDECIDKGAVPAGLGARDILRLEMGFPLYGHELCLERNAAQSGFSRAVSRKKEFIGSNVVLDSSAAAQLLVGITIEGRRSAKQNDIIVDESGNHIGIITSGAFSPALGCAIALGYVNKEYSIIGTSIKIISGKNEFLGKVSELPFYKNAAARDDIKKYL